MGKRREGREVAIQLLFHWDLNQCATITAEDLNNFFTLRAVAGSVKHYAVQTLEGVIKHQAEIDKQITRYTANYELKRISAVDRNILRLAIYEMLHVPDVPPIVAINEAIDIAKKYGTEESSRFVNGILDRVKIDLKRPLRTSLPATETQG
jgi:N utilization substance protein B